MAPAIIITLTYGLLSFTILCNDTLYNELTMVYEYDKRTFDF